MSKARDISTLGGVAGVYPGTVAYFFTATAPDGWLACIKF